MNKETELKSAIEYFKENNPSLFGGDKTCGRIAHAKHLQTLITHATSSQQEVTVEDLVIIIDKAWNRVGECDKRFLSELLNQHQMKVVRIVHDKMD